eukprot:2241367-Rhodomonas_salina.1
MGTRCVLDLEVKYNQEQSAKSSTKGEIKSASTSKAVQTRCQYLDPERSSQVPAPSVQFAAREWRCVP